MDEVDQIVAREESLLAARVQRARHAAPSGAPSLVCLGCGELIPEERRRALPGCCLCVDCQAEIERTRP